MNGLWNHMSLQPLCHAAAHTVLENTLAIATINSHCNVMYYTASFPNVLPQRCICQEERIVKNSVSLALCCAMPFAQYILLRRVCALSAVVKQHHKKGGLWHRPTRARPIFSGSTCHNFTYSKKENQSLNHEVAQRPRSVYRAVTD